MGSETDLNTISEAIEVEIGNNRKYRSIYGTITWLYMFDLNDYFYFVHVVEKQGFSQAAKILNMPKSRLSRHVSKLEERLDIKLIQRTSRQFKVTESGHIFYKHALSVIQEVETAEAVMLQKKKSLSGRVAISCSLGVAQYVLRDLLLEFLQDNPKVELVQQVTNQMVDLVSSGVDLTIRGHTDPLPDSSNIQRHLANVPWHLFASPGYLKAKGVPESPYDLYHQQTLKAGSQVEISHWLLQDSQGIKTSIAYTPQLCSDDMGTLIQGAVNGMGIVSLPAYTCKEQVAAGTLIRVLPDWISGKAQLSLLTPSRRSSSAPVRILRDHLIENVSKQVGDK